MIPITDRFRAALSGSRNVIVEADVLTQGIVVQSGLLVVDGAMTADSGSQIRRRLACTILDLDKTLIPTHPTDLLWPNGNELRIRCGIEYPDGETEFISIGVFRIARPRFVDSGFGVEINIEGYDRSRTIRRSRFPEPHVVPRGKNYGEAIFDLIQEMFPWSLEISNFMTTTRTTPQLLFEAQDDPWKAAEDMAASLGAEVFFDGEGKLTLRPEPDPEEGEIVWDYSEGQDCTLIALDRDLDDERTYNHVIVTGETTDNEEAVRAEAIDENPTSPTYIGTYGRVTYWQPSPYITTEDQAQDAANAALRRVVGTSEQINFEGIANLAHEPGDILRISREKLKIEARYVLDAFSLPFNPEDTMSGTTRQRRL